MKIYTKQELVSQLKKIVDLGWIPSSRHGNHGGIGNTLEDLLGIEENNLPIPNAAEWELKTQRQNTTSLITLFHCEPSPRALKFVPQIFLPNYGWNHQEAGKKYLKDEMSFRQTVHGKTFSDRGFGVKVDRKNKKILISFDYRRIDSKHQEWLSSVDKKIGLEELNPQPYWGFDDLEYKAGTKLLNCFFVIADAKKEDRREFFNYTKIMMCRKFDFENFLKAIENAQILIDFDARTGHNHGTKFRIKQNCLPSLYAEVNEL